MSKEVIHFQVGIEIEGQDASIVAQAIRYWLDSNKEGALDSILDCLCDAPFSRFPGDVEPPINWHFGEGRVELDASPFSAWQTSTN